ncbi:hypothetical protein FDECE_10348 [Fusarium decemcellulare]|nr:hypothetical protein FDECE_10348 [Fusarium decemcellulare]
MDPLSISASIAGLVSLADLVYRASTKYVRGFKGAREEVQNLSREIKNLSVVLHNLSLVAFDLEENQPADSSQQTSGLKPHHLHDCQQLLMNLEKSLFNKEAQLDSKSRLERLQGRLKWPFSSDETKELIQDVQRHKQIIDLALGAESLSKLKILLSRQSDTNDRVEKVQLTVDELLKAQTKIADDKRHDDVLGVFKKASPYREFETNRKLRYDLTGLWLTEGPDFQDWYTTPGSKIWFTGIPGAGKSVLAAAIIEECLKRNAVNPGTSLAYFFCTYRDGSTHSATSILSSLCAQLALQNESAFRILEEYYDELRSDRHLSQEPSTGGLTKVLHRMRTVYSRVYLVVDGLDECGNQVATSVRKLVALVTSQVDEVISLALLSRDEILIREILEDRFHNVEIAAHTEDIRLYVASELEQRITRRELRLRDLDLKDQILNRLVDGAKGMFRWVVCQLDHLCELPTDRARKQALDKLPPTLFATYERILMKIEGYSDDVKQMVQRMLLLISSESPQMRDTLGLQEMCEVISLADGSDTLYDDEIVEKAEVLRWCSSLVRTSNEGHKIEFAHFSVQEYLQGECLKHPTLNAYGVSEEKSCEVIGSLCIRYLTLKNHERLPEHEEYEIFYMIERHEQRPFFEYASIYWPHYLYYDEGDKEPPVFLAYDLFQLPKTPSFCAWAIEFILHCLDLDNPETIFARGVYFEGYLHKDEPFVLEVISAVIRPDFTPLHMAAVLWMPDLCRYLLDKGANASLRSKFGSPLHCAIGGLSVFTTQTDTIEDKGQVFLNLPYSFGRRADQQQTVRLLLEAGSSTQLQFKTPLWSSSVSALSLAVISTHVTDGFEIVVDLVTHGTVILEEDLPYFRKHYDHCIEHGIDVEEEDLNGGESFIKLLDLLGDQTTTGTPGSRLYAETLTFVGRVGVGVPHQLLTDKATDEQLSEWLQTWIAGNDVFQLERLLETGRSELVKSVRFNTIGPGWTPLHMAVQHQSFDVLNALLDFGLDPNTRALDGTTPIHRCRDRDTLRALLQHGGSTLIPDIENMTIWHTSYYSWFKNLVDQLVELDERDNALQMVSSKNETPICAALNMGLKECVSKLLKYCNSKRFWISDQSIFRKAAYRGWPEVIQTLLEAGVEPDGMDAYSGNPLHFLSNNTNLNCVLMLKKVFPLNYRRQMDNRTPAELMLAQSLRGEVRWEEEIFAALLPATVLSDSLEASTLWSFACSAAVPVAMYKTTMVSANWIGRLFDKLIELGIAKLYEEETNRPALLPFVSGIDDGSILTYAQLYHHIKIPQLVMWDWFSMGVRSIGKITSCWAGTTHERSLLQLLFAAIHHDDYKIIHLLISNGIDMHSKVDALSPLEFACLPNVEIGAAGFNLLMAHARPEQIALGMHYTAGMTRQGNGSASKLKRLLQTEIDCNLPMSAEYGPPLVHHINQGALNTAKVLLNAGADPWARGEFPLDAALAAVKNGHVSMLAKIAAMPPRNSRPHHWGQTWTETIDGKCFADGNALHLAASRGDVECLKFYLDRKLLRDLEAVDRDFETPMHYAARSNSSSVIRLLWARGGNINARNHFGVTPLHLATVMQHLDSVLTLIELGAENVACHAGITPLTYAYQDGGLDIIEALQRSYGIRKVTDTMLTPLKVPRQTENGLTAAILRSDITACKMSQAIGSPINMELRDPESVTPLELAIYRQKNTGIIEWLLGSDATVSTTFSELYAGRFSSALETAVAQPALNPLLPRLLTRCWKEGSDFLEMRCSPLDIAIQHGNQRGLEVILDWLRDTYGSQDNSTKDSDFRQRHNSSHPNTLVAYVNQRNVLWPHESVLHSAARAGGIEPIKKLIENGANVGATNGYNNTPLHIAAAFGSLDVVKCLLECGARPDALNEVDCTPLMVACSYARWEVMETLAQYYQSGVETDCAGRSLLHILIQYTDAEDATPNDRIFHQCLDKEVDLHRVNALGWSAIQGLMISPTAVYLRSLLNRDARLLQPQRMAPWSDLVFGGKARAIDTLAKRFRWLGPFMTKDDMFHLSGLARPGNHSLMCRAACWGSIEAIENFIASGVDDLEHRCDDHGTPLNAAILRLRIETVKTLVRHGAQVPYQLSSPKDSKISMANPEFVIRQWLFVGRYLDRMGVTDGTADDTAWVGGWAGPRTAQVALKWEWRKASDETMLEYASRRHKVLKSLRGKVVKPVGWIEKGYDWRPEDNSYAEEVQATATRGPIVVPLTRHGVSNIKSASARHRIVLQCKRLPPILPPSSSTSVLIMSTPGLLRLPAETITEIINLSHPSAHFNLACTCRQLAQYSEFILQRHRATHLQYEVVSDLCPTTIPALLRNASEDPFDSWHIRSLELWHTREDYAEWTDPLEETGPLRVPLLEDELRFCVHQLRRAYIWSNELMEARSLLWVGCDSPLKVALVISCPRLTSLTYNFTDGDSPETLKWLALAIRKSCEGDSWFGGLATLRDVSIGVHSGTALDAAEGTTNQRYCDLFTAVLKLPKIRSVYFRGMTRHHDEAWTRSAFLPGSSAVEHIFLDEVSSDINSRFRERMLWAPRALKSLTIRGLPGSGSLLEDVDDFVRWACTHAKTIESIMLYNTAGARSFGYKLFQVDRILSELPSLRLISGDMQNFIIKDLFRTCSMFERQHLKHAWKNSAQLHRCYKHVLQAFPESLEVLVLSNEDPLHDYQVDMIEDILIVMVQCERYAALKAVYIEETCGKHVKSLVYRGNNFKMLADIGWAYGVDVHVRSNTHPPRHQVEFPTPPKMTTSPAEDLDTRAEGREFNPFTGHWVARN